MYLKLTLPRIRVGKEFLVHIYADEKIVDWLNQNQYHPRSNKHGSALCLSFLDDLLEDSPKIKKAAQNGEIVYSEDLKVGQDPLSWTVDLIVGPPKEKLNPLVPINGILDGVPKEIMLAVDAKSVMTEHGKARRNRQRDLNSLAGIVKQYHKDCVVGGLLMVNNSTTFQSPLTDHLTIHKNINRLVDETIQMFNQIPRSQLTGGPGIEAVGVVVVNHTNDPNDTTSLVTKYPAPPIGDMANYSEALEIMKRALETRFFK